MMNKIIKRILGTGAAVNVELGGFPNKVTVTHKAGTNPDIYTAYLSPNSSNPTDSGDSSTCTLWKFLGLNYGNTLAGVLYVTLTSPDTGAFLSSSALTIKVYKDAAKTALVAEGTRLGNGFITFTEKNNSGINGEVNVGAYTADDVDIVKTFDISYTIVETGSNGNMTYSTTAATQIIPYAGSSTKSRGVTLGSTISGSGVPVIIEAEFTEEIL